MAADAAAPNAAAAIAITAEERAERPCFVETISRWWEDVLGRRVVRLGASAEISTTGSGLAGVGGAGVRGAVMAPTGGTLFRLVLPSTAPGGGDAGIGGALRCTCIPRRACSAPGDEASVAAGGAADGNGVPRPGATVRSSASAFTF